MHPIFTNSKETDFSYWLCPKSCFNIQSWAFIQVPSPSRMTLLRLRPPRAEAHPQQRKAERRDQDGGRAHPGWGRSICREGALVPLRREGSENAVDMFILLLSVLFVPVSLVPGT